MGTHEFESFGLQDSEVLQAAGDFERRVIAAVVDYRNALLLHAIRKIGTRPLDAETQVGFNRRVLASVVGLLQPRLERWRDRSDFKIDVDALGDPIDDSLGG